MKIKLTSESMPYHKSGETLYRIEAIEDIPIHNVKKGDKGGFISTLYVNGADRISGDAWVFDNAQVYGNALVYGQARVYGNALVSDNARVGGYAEVYGEAEVCANAKVYDEARVYGNALVYGQARVYGNALVSDNARVGGYAEVYGEAEVCANALVYGQARVYGYAKVSGEAEVCANALVSGEAHIDSPDAIAVISIGGFYAVTITRKLIFVGCEAIKRSDVKSFSKEEAVKRGVPEHLFENLKKCILAGMKIVKRNPGKQE